MWLRQFLLTLDYAIPSFVLQDVSFSSYDVLDLAGAANLGNATNATNAPNATGLADVALAPSRPDLGELTSVPLSRLEHPSRTASPHQRAADPPHSR